VMPSMANGTTPCNQTRHQSEHLFPDEPLVRMAAYDPLRTLLTDPKPVLTA